MECLDSTRYLAAELRSDLQVLYLHNDSAIAMQLSCRQLSSSAAWCVERVVFRRSWLRRRVWPSHSRW